MGITLHKVRSEKHASWPPEAMAAHEARHPIGTKARLAFALARYTGQGRTEVARFGRPVKRASASSSGRKPRPRQRIPVLPQLQAIIDAPLVGLRTLLVTEAGKPYRPAEPGRQGCRFAGL
jgi:hypothetical protein